MPHPPSIAAPPSDEDVAWAFSVLDAWIHETPMPYLDHLQLLTRIKLLQSAMDKAAAKGAVEDEDDDA